MYFNVRNRRCGVRACEANQMCESHGQCVRVGSTDIDAWSEILLRTWFVSYVKCLPVLSFFTRCISSQGGTGSSLGKHTHFLFTFSQRDIKTLERPKDRQRLSNAISSNGAHVKLIGWRLQDTFVEIRTPVARPTSQTSFEIVDNLFTFLLCA